MYFIGKTGCGKSSTLKTLCYQDVFHGGMEKGRGFILMDPNGDLVSEVMELIPPERNKDVIYLDVTDPSVAVGFNPLQQVDPHKRAWVASGILEAFIKIYGAQNWGQKQEFILRNILLTLLDNKGSTFEDIPRLLHDKEFRNQCISNVSNKQVKNFWYKEFPKYNPRFDFVPIFNKAGSFLTIPIIQKILVDNTNCLDLRNIMDSGKILLVNLSLGLCGSDAVNLLGSLILTSLSTAAFSRVELKPEERKPFFVYLDEFQNYVGSKSINDMLSQLRKFSIGFILANQYRKQLPAEVQHAVFGNAGSIISYRTDFDTASYLAKEFFPTFEPIDFINLENYSIYVRLFIDNKMSKPFSAKTIQVQDLPS